MNKFLKWALIIVGVLLLLGFVGFKVLQHNTKKFSPEDTVTLSMDGLDLQVFYNRPSKKGRTIFGGLVPYDKVWRTGANEATTFTTNKPLRIGDGTLPAGTYTLWTIPGAHEWTVIFNKKMYPWGVDWNSQASRQAEHDAVRLIVPVETVETPVEMFTIALQGEPLAMTLTWDNVRITVPIAQ
ncbi:MAG: DUF2911 domain-containing protein [Flavobacteriales bacterium]|nr:DUF2911 domain-containing protein [Flavobacteriales bacterium]